MSPLSTQNELLHFNAQQGVHSSQKLGVVGLLKITKSPNLLTSPNKKIGLKTMKIHSKSRICNFTILAFFTNLSDLSGNTVGLRTSSF